MGFVAVTVPAVGDQVTAATGAAIAADINAGPNMGTPKSSAVSGTPSTGVEIRDAVLGDYVFTAVAGRRYRAVVDGLMVGSTVAGDLFGVTIRNGGNATPTVASTQVAGSQVFVGAVGGSGTTSCAVSGSFTPGAGLVTLSVFLARRNGTGTGTPFPASNSIRELYALDIGPA